MYKLIEITTKQNKECLKTSLNILSCRVYNKNISFVKKNYITSHRYTQEGINNHQVSRNYWPIF